MKRAVIAVDVQLDFLPNGALAVPDGHQAIPRLAGLIEWEGTDVVVVSQDWHPLDHFSFSSKPEFKDGSWPVHCVAGTPGAELDWQLVETLEKIDKPIVYVRKGVHKDIEAYSAFDGRVVDQKNTDLDLKGKHLHYALAKLGVVQVIVGGLALDYCVRATAIAASVDFDTFVSLDATRPVALSTGLRAVADLAEYGVDFW